MEELIKKFFRNSKNKILNTLMERVVRRFKSKATYPAFEYPAVFSGSLIAALMGGKSSITMSSDDSIERTIKLPYANIIRHSFVQPVTIKQRMFFRQMYKNTKDIKWKLMSKAQTLKHPSLDYLKNWVDSKEVAKILMQSIKDNKSELISQYERDFNVNINN